MRVSHTELANCQRNPAAWVSQHLRGAPNGPRMGYDGYTKLAIYHFHKTGDRTESHEHLRQLLKRRDFHNPQLAPRSEQNLSAYIDWVQTQQPVVALWRVRINLRLGLDFTIGGEVSRVDVDLDTGGYRGVLIGKRAEAWETELRMPVLQRALALKLERPEEEISVGFQDIDGDDLEVTAFKSNEVSNAVQQAEEIGRLLAAEWERQGGDARFDLGASRPPETRR